MLSPPSSAWHCQTPAVAGEVPNELTVTLDHLPEAALAPQHGALVSKFSVWDFLVMSGRLTARIDQPWRVVRTGTPGRSFIL